MTALRILGAIFLGRNTGNLALRFEYHLLTIVGLSVSSSVAATMKHIALNYAALNETAPDFVAACASSYEGLFFATVAMTGYTLLAMAALLVLGILPRGEPDAA